MIFKKFRTYQIQKVPVYADNIKYIVSEKKYDSLIRSLVNKLKKNNK